jgi:hypothetical protein
VRRLAACRFAFDAIAVYWPDVSAVTPAPGIIHVSPVTKPLPERIEDGRDDAHPRAR